MARVNFEIGNKSNLGFFVFLNLTLRAFFVSLSLNSTSEKLNKSFELDAETGFKFLNIKERNSISTLNCGTLNLGFIFGKYLIFKKPYY
ncbi:hypothetical protein BpHYR1_015599 [Brachionus plicatilis]|uniref:Uncharacterized protein n=1 Tax=Brachionus plicatilis TaxID=10195 RepID=A0A3M7PRM9_BRAPC|nr:hypothetical protein BpHYR1_015599 [Brachionus plicatilis]